MKLPSMTTIRHWPVWIPRGRGRLAGLVLSVLVLAGSLTQMTIAWATELPDNAVLRVGDTTVTEDQFQQRIKVLTALYGVKPPPAGPDLDRFYKDAAKSVAVSMILDRAAQDPDVAVADKQAQDALNKTVEQQPGGRDAFVKFLGSQGISERDVTEEVKRQLATNKLFDKVTSHAGGVNDADVQAAFHDHQDRMVTPEQRHLRNIVVGSQEEAGQILAQAQSGADFAGLAKRSSLDSSTKDKGGDLGTVSADQLDEAFAKAAFAAPPNSVFGPVQTKYGWNVGQILEVKPAQPLAFDQVKQQLTTELESQRKLDAWRPWLADQIKSANVDYADRYRPDDPDAPPADLPK